MMRRIYIWSCPSCGAWQVECDASIILDEENVNEPLNVALTRHYTACATTHADLVATQGWTFNIVELA